MNRIPVYNVVLGGRFFKQGFPKKRKKNPPDAENVRKNGFVRREKTILAVFGLVDSFFAKRGKIIDFSRNRGYIIYVASGIDSPENVFF